jgi:hypothetical protein
MERQQRRMVVFRGRSGAEVDPEVHLVENALRGRTARKARALLRRLERVALVTPRWSAPQGFLEDLALDLAVGEPKLACRTVAMRPVMGRTEAEAWNYLLRVIAELAGPDAARRPVPMVCTRAGFQHAADHLLDRAHAEAPLPVALLGHGAEHLPLDVLQDLSEAWARYAERVEGPRRCTLLLAGSARTPALSSGMSATLDLGDYGPSEAAATMVLQMGPVPIPMLQAAARFSGGVPALVHALATGVAEHATLPTDADAMLRCLGPMADELRSVVSMALMSLDAADRFYALADGGAHPEVPALDDALRNAGLVRRTRGAAGSRVELRSPALALVAG